MPQLQQSVLHNFFSSLSRCSFYTPFPLLPVSTACSLAVHFTFGVCKKVRQYFSKSVLIDRLIDNYRKRGSASYCASVTFVRGRERERETAVTSLISR